MVSGASPGMSVGWLLNVLGVEPPGTNVHDPVYKQAVREGFRQWARENHPDKGGNTAKFQLVSDAHDKLQAGGLPTPLAPLRKSQQQRAARGSDSRFRRAPGSAQSSSTNSTSAADSARPQSEFVSEQIGQLHIEQRAPRLVEFLDKIKLLPDTARHAAWKGAMRLIESLPIEDRTKLLISSVDKIVLLPESARAEAFGDAFRQLNHLPASERSQFLAALIPAYFNTPAVTLPPFSLLQLVKQLSPVYRTAPLDAALRVGDSMPETSRMEMYALVLSQAEQLPAEYRGPLLIALADRIPSLAEADRCKLHGSILHQVEHLTAGERSQLLVRLIPTYFGIPPVLRPPFAYLTQLVEQVPPEYQAPPLDAFLRTSDALPETSRMDMYKLVLSLARQLSAEYRGPQLVALANWIPRLPEADRLKAFGIVLDQAGQLLGQPRRDARRALSHTFKYLPTDDLEEARTWFNQVGGQQ